MTLYLIFSEIDYTNDEGEVEPGYAIIGTAEAPSLDAAIRRMAASEVGPDEPKRLWATPARSWKGLAVKTQVVTRTENLALELEDEAPEPEPEPEPEPVEDETPYVTTPSER